jgi:hypothetical protein
MSQLELSMKPEMLKLDAKMIDAQPTLTKAIVLCQQLSGLDDKELCGPQGVVKDVAQWSRIKSGQHFFPQDKFSLLMDSCENEAPLFWLARRRGYNLVPMENELERQIRKEREGRIEAERKLAYLETIVRGR